MTFPIVAVLALLVTERPARGADPCGFPEECASGFCVGGVCCDTACTGLCEACTAAAKGSGEDGFCGPAKEGTVCKKAYCDDALAFVSASLCDAAGSCVDPTTPPESCIHDDPCKIDLCGDNGCEVVVKFDGTECGAGMTCQDGMCAGGGASSSSSSSTSGSGGAGGSGGGSGGAGGSGGGSGGAGGSGGVGGDPYPPIRDTGCGCRLTETSPLGGAAALVMAALALLGRTRKLRTGTTSRPRPRSPRS
ncbi:MYXO-CTERM sorting domain-containing protein [Polyangium jinanense]|uniref:Disintegrin domain-containing protein n=1 Tax=Polyangium jinanense TaxID=2829994 RepID=A0A9X3XEV5_9BACT|nr:MYXO-CTERM sorting domain-containing protein [Polyangium jinanense]MDC3961526.1 hypothetical protein [Polyangium jinanense]MDC3989027.1 hypothetical protein [Polyangium jinanense]